MLGCAHAKFHRRIIHRHNTRTRYLCYSFGDWVEVLTMRIKESWKRNNEGYSFACSTCNGRVGYRERYVATNIKVGNMVKNLAVCLRCEPTITYERWS